MITLTITGESMEQVMKSLGGPLAVGGLVSPGNGEKAASTDKVTPKTEKPKTEKAAPVVETTSKPATSDAPATYTIEDVKAMVPKLVQKITREQLVELLATYGAKKGSEVPVDKIADFMSKANVLMAA